ncbi:MAG TPA: hypothetical protein VG322_00035 [Candidatus Acidoferrales bacterium]|nr:hypothetical protein [Candidatus Acidoferrales bacterium]
MATESIGGAMQAQARGKFPLAGGHEPSQPVPGDVADPEVALFAALFTARELAMLFEGNQGEDGIHHGFGVAVAIGVVIALSHGGWRADDHARAQGSGLEKQVKIVQVPAFRRAVFGAADLLERGTANDDEIIDVPMSICFLRKSWQTETLNRDVLHGGTGSSPMKIVRRPIRVSWAHVELPEELQTELDLARAGSG